MHLLISLLVNLATLITTAQAWWGTGHMLVARIAEQVLEQNHPEVLKKVHEVLKQDVFVNYIHLEDKFPMVECSTFADQIKGAGFSD